LAFSCQKKKPDTSKNTCFVLCCSWKCNFAAVWMLLRRDLESTFVLRGIAKKAINIRKNLKLLCPEE
jgi:hypothetical protein